MASLNSSTTHYSLRSCLCEGPLGVDNDVDEMWPRLDKKYGDPYNELKPSKRGKIRDSWSLSMYWKWL